MYSLADISTPPITATDIYSNALVSIISSRGAAVLLSPARAKATPVKDIKAKTGMAVLIDVLNEFGAKMIIFDIFFMVKIPRI